MGFETFRVELRGGAATYAQAEETVRQLPHARPDHDSIASLGSDAWRKIIFAGADWSAVLKVVAAAPPPLSSIAWRAASGEIEKTSCLAAVRIVGRT